MRTTGDILEVPRVCNTCKAINGTLLLQEIGVEWATGADGVEQRCDCWRWGRRRPGPPPDRSSKEGLGRGQVARPGQPAVEHLSILIDTAVEVVPLAGCDRG